MSISKGKQDIFTILDSFSQYLMAILCTRDCVTKATHEVYYSFLHHQEIPSNVSSQSRPTLITQRLHCSSRSQSSGNIKLQHNEKCSLHIVWWQELWMNQCPQICSHLHECHSQHHTMSSPVTMLLNTDSLYIIKNLH